MNSFPAPVARSRPSWSGLLRFSLVALPVKAYPAVSTKETPHAHLLHARCGQRIRYEKHCPEHGTVASEDIVKGYAYGQGQHLVVDPEELERLRPEKDKALLLEQFVAPSAIDPTRYAGRSLYLWPDSPAARQPYAVLVQALTQAGKAGLARVVLTGTRQLVLVRPRDSLLVLDLLHYPAQVKDVRDWNQELLPTTPAAAELDLAGQLIALASTPLDWSHYRDSSAQELEALLQAKLLHQPPAAAATGEPAVLNLLEALQKSVAATRKPAEPVQRRPRARRKTG